LHSFCVGPSIAGAQKGRLHQHAIISPA
jgi:hypothetical protein